MKKQIENILKELYKIDNSLEKKENDLKKIIAKMIELKPNIKIDESFKNELKFKIDQKLINKNIYKNNKINDFFKIISYIISGALITIFSFYINNNYLNLKENKTNKTEIENISNNNLGGIQNIQSDENIETSPIKGTERLFSKSSDNKKTPQELEVFKYIYDGDLSDLKLPNEMIIYKNEKKEIKDLNIGEYFKKIDFSGIDLGSFSNLNIKNININENSKYGYNINIDFENNNLNIYKNDSKWENINGKNTLGDDKILSIATDFIKQHKINIINYGIPYIEKQSNIDKNNYYENKFVIYPLILDGKEIFGENGENIGIKMEINQNYKKVINLYNLSLNNYTESLDKIETDKKNISKIINVGGKYGLGIIYDSNVKYIDVKVKNPKIKYIQSFIFENNISKEYISPVIEFEVEKKQNLYQDKIIIPLWKNILNYDKNGFIIGYKG